MFPKSYEVLTRDFRYFFYRYHSFSNMTRIQKLYVQVACRYPASYRQQKKIRHFFLTLAVKAM
jgi:hypothetical protein